MTGSASCRGACLPHDTNFFSQPILKSKRRGCGRLASKWSNRELQDKQVQLAWQPMQIKYSD